jgi:steroid 5-alpha reductase family enzyme
MLRSRGDRYRDYQSRTSQFFPLPPQTGAVKKGVVT